ncbi:HAD family hydrolase [Paraburkholderia elongata]|uniref:Uncharacterized protein n=1 Tax=Paraburkholderia elongata TaxID=2675747 RepID=A0A972NVE4_9BURK|nr:hypothetical protein [Paraburkholderia elongata]NPT59806.1 hypothetical protein [Paraburkholderia elongata]
MSHARANAHETEHDQDMQAQLCAYNTAFAELGLRFRWDERTLASLATIDGERERIAAYLEAHHAHLLKAYSAEFLSQAILEKKSARYPVCFATRRESTASVNNASDLLRAGSQWERSSCDPDLPALAGV